jgi:hypothetical protein
MMLPDLDTIASMSEADAVALLGALEVLRTRILQRLLVSAPVVASAEPQHPLPAAEVAARRGLSTKLVRFLARTQRVPSVQHGRRRLVRLADVDRYLTDCRARGIPVG